MSELSVSARGRDDSGGQGARHGGVPLRREVVVVGQKGPGGGGQQWPAQVDSPQPVVASLS